MIGKVDVNCHARREMMFYTGCLKERFLFISDFLFLKPSSSNTMALSSRVWNWMHLASDPSLTPY